jgi:hypothetical protein
VATTIGIVSSDQEAMGTMACFMVRAAFLQNLGIMVKMTNTSEIEGTFHASIYVQRKESLIFEPTSLYVDQVMAAGQSGSFCLINNSNDLVGVGPGDRITLWVCTLETSVIFTVNQLSGGLELCYRRQ